MRRIELFCFLIFVSDECCRSGFCGGGNGRDDGLKVRFVIFRYLFDWWKWVWFSGKINLF